MRNMKSSPEVQKERQPNPELRSITPESIAESFDKRIASVRITFVDHDPIIIPDDWHGAGKQGEALVQVGDMLTEPMAGTKLSADEFIDWLVAAKGFTITSEPGAAQLMESDLHGTASWPLVRLTRAGHGKTPIEIQIYRGGACKELQELSFIGNKPAIDKRWDDHESYNTAVRALFSPFISKGTKDARERMGLRGHVDILRRVDDCLASGITILGDQMIDERMQTPKERLVEVIDVSVATTQAITVAIAMAEYREIPLIMRVGAPAFGLGDGKNLNYMVNTIPELTRYGNLTVGDMGNLMDMGDSAAAQPEMRALSPHEDLREVRLFLGGGLPVMRIMKKEYESRGKPFILDTTLRRASRVDNGPKNWAVLISGTNLIVRPSRKDSIFLPTDREVWLNQYGKYKYIEHPGLWVSLGGVYNDLGLQEAFFFDRGTRRTIYFSTPAETSH